jgi:hypothetical protein
MTGMVTGEEKILMPEKVKDQKISKRGYGEKRLDG